MNFRDRLLEQLAPFQTIDNSGHFYILCDAIGAMFQPVEDLASDGPNGEPGWSILLDIDRIPAAYLGYLAQFVGVRLVNGLDDAAQRERVRSCGGFNRGRPASIVAAAKQSLTGNQNVILVERDGSPWRYTVITFTDETPDQTQTLSDLMDQKPGPDILNYEVHVGQDFAQLRDGFTSFGVVKSTFATFDDVRKFIPLGGGSVWNGQVVIMTSAVSTMHLIQAGPAGEIDIHTSATGTLSGGAVNKVLVGQVSEVTAFTGTLHCSQALASASIAAVTSATGTVSGGTSKMQTLTDGFSILDGTKWNNTAGAGIAVSGGKLGIPCLTTYPQVTSKTIYDLTDSYFSVNITPPATNSGGKETGISLDVTAVAGTVNNLSFEVEHATNLLSPVIKLAGVTTSGTTIAFNQATTPWIRVRHSSSTHLIYFEYSADRVTWTTLWSHSDTGVVVNGLYAMMWCGYWGTEAAATGYFAWVNMAPTMYGAANVTTTVSGNLSGGEGTPNLSGIAMPIGNLAAGANNSVAGVVWTQQETEDFTSLSTLNVNPYGVITDTSGKGWRDGPATASIVGGSTLDVYCRYGYKNSNPDGSGGSGAQGWLGAVVKKNSGRLSSGGGGQLYGRYDICCRFTQQMAGMKMALMLYDLAGDWHYEIDFPETDADVSSSIGVGGAVHWWMNDSSRSAGDIQSWWTGAGGDSHGTGTGLKFVPTDWHVYTIEWTPSAYYFYIDYQLVRTELATDGQAIGADSPYIPAVAAQYIMQIETSTDSETPSGSTHWQADWLVLYSYPGY